MAHENDCVGVNLVGIRRAGFSKAEIAEVREAYRLLYRSGKTFRAAVEELAATTRTPAGKRLAEFVAIQTKRGICGAAVQASTGGTPPADEESAEGASSPT